MEFTGQGTDEQGRKGLIKVEWTPTRAASLIGARGGPSNALVNFMTADEAIGPLDTTRLFYSQSLPPAMGLVESTLPPGVVPVVSYKQQDTNVASYVQSVNRPLWLCYHHEPGGDYREGQQFTREFTAQAELIRAQQNHNVTIVMVSGGYQMSPGHGESDGSFLPPPDAVDVYGLDCYQHQLGSGPDAWPTSGLRSYPRFQNWLSMTGPTGLPLALTEYGIDADSPDPLAAAEIRNERLTEDAEYLRTLGLAMWSYWWVPNPAPSHDYRFTDPATVETWRAITQGLL